jgi:hypothetical protein
MTVTITRDPAVTAITPDLFQGYTTEQTARTNIHALIGTAAPAYDLLPAGLRTGTMTLVFKSRAAAHACRAAHAGVGVFTLRDTDVPDANMAYIVTGTVRIEVDGTTAAAWLVTVGFQEVAP